MVIQEVKIQIYERLFLRGTTKGKARTYLKMSCEYTVPGKVRESKYLMFFFLKKLSCFLDIEVLS